MLAERRNMKIDFSGQTVLVTGASRELGFEIAKECAACGAAVIATSTQPMKTEEAHATFGNQAKNLVVDFSSPASTEKFIASIRALSRLDVLINNTGIARHAPLSSATLEEWRYLYYRSGVGR